MSHSPEDDSMKSLSHPTVVIEYTGNTGVQHVLDTSH
jgi:hypothetical protein